ncbi:MAG: F0F1 ATP synthase subunit B', partial [Pseudomonadota bacterium]
MADSSSHSEDGYEAAGYAGEAHGAAEGIFPPFDPTYFSSQLFWLTITFVALYFVLSRVALPRIATVIEERRDKIAEDLDHAAELKLESENAVASYEKALADAKAKAVAIAAETREGLDSEISEMQAEVDQRLSEK